MLNDLLQSKNAAAALILLVAGVLLAVVLPAWTGFPGWAAGSIGLSIGAIGGLIALQGRGANRDELLALRTAIKAAQRGERAARSPAISADLQELFAAIDDVACEVESHKLRARDSDGAVDRVRAELAQRDEQANLTSDDLARALDGLSQLLLEQSSCTDQLALASRQTLQVFGESGDELEQLSARASASSAAWTSLGVEGDEFEGGVSALLLRARDSAGALDAIGHELRALDQSMRAATASLESAAIVQRELERRIDEGQGSSGQAARLSEQLGADAERGVEAVERVRSEVARFAAGAKEAGEAISGLGSRIDALRGQLDAVDDLAEQMTLLGLNAAIIAAQAGDHGKGFGVVADGMKDLADRAQVASKQLSAVVTGVGDQVASASRSRERSEDAMERAGSATLEAALLARRTQEAAQRLAQLSAPGAREPSERSKPGSDALERVSGAVQQLAGSVAQCVRELAPLGAHADELRSGALQLERKQHERAARSRQAASQAEAFERSLEQLCKAQRSQRRALEEVGPCLERMRELLRAHEQRIGSLASLSQGLQRR